MASGLAARLARCGRAAACLLALTLATFTLAAGAAGAQDTTFVKNTGQTAASGYFIVGPSGGAIWQHAAIFTTGDNAAGYTLSEIVVRTTSGAPAGGAALVSVYTTSGGLPDASLHVLTNPSSFAGEGLKTFTAPAGAMLDANTTYAVVLDVTASATGTWGLNSTASTAEDTGAASGWSIGDDRKQRDRATASNAWQPWSDGIPHIEVKGTLGAADTAAPTLVSASVNGDMLILTFDEALASTATPASAFLVTEAGKAAANPASVAVDSTTVALTLARGVTPGRDVLLTYIAPDDDPLKDAAGNEVASFFAETVTNDTPGALEDAMDGCTDADCPDAPTGGAVAGTNHGEITVSWTAASTGGTANQWNLKVTPDGGSTTTVNPPLAGTARSHTFTGLDPTKDHDVVVQGIGGTSNNKFGDAAVARDVRPKDANGPAFASAEVSGKTLSVTFDEALGTGSLPAGSAFTVSVTRSGTATTLNGTGTASVSGAVATVTLDGRIANGETVTASYTAPTSDPLQDAFGNDAPNFSAQTVANNTPVDSTPPAFASATVNGSTLTVTFDEALDSGSAPAGSAFSVLALRRATYVGFKRYLSGTGTATLSGMTATVTLSEPVYSGDTLQVRYTKPGTGPLQDAAGNEVANFSSQSATNDTPATGAPTLLRAGVAVQTKQGLQVTGNEVFLVFSRELAAAPDLTNAAFTVKFNGTPVALHSQRRFGPSINGNRVTLTMLATISVGTGTITVSYARPAEDSARLKGRNGAPVAPFTDRPVTTDNRVPTKGSNAQDQLANAPGNTQVSQDLDLAQFSDPDGDPLTFTMIASPPGTIDPRFPLTHNQGSKRLFFYHYGNLCHLAKTRSPGYAGNHITVVTVTATDPHGASVSVTRRFQTPLGNNNVPHCPTLADAAVDGAALTLTYRRGKGASAAANPPPSGLSASEFTVTVDGEAVAVTSISYGADTDAVNMFTTPVTLTLAEPVKRPRQVVTVSHTPGRNPSTVRFFDRQVTNNTPPDVTPPVFADAVVVGDVLAVTFDEPLDEASAPPGSAFSLTVTPPGVEPRTIAGTGQVSVSGTTATLTLAEAVGYGEEVTASYAKPESGPLQDLDANEVADFTGKTVRNDEIVDEDRPKLRAATFQGDRLTLTFDEWLNPHFVPNSNYFKLWVDEDDRSHRITAVAVKGVTVVLTLSSAPGAGQAVTVNYNALGHILDETQGRPSRNVRDLAGNHARAFTKDADHGAPPARQPDPSSPVPPSPGGGGAPPPGGGVPPGLPGAPVADAGADIDVDPGARVSLDGSGSSDPDGDALAYAWERLSGAAVTLSGAGSARAAFTAPALPGDLGFRLTVTDPGGLSDEDEVTVTVRDLAPRFDRAVASLVLVAGEAMDPVVLPLATGGNGALAHGLSSAPAGLAGLTFDPATRRLSGTPPAEGDWTFTWRADDADGNRSESDAAILSFGVRVDDSRTALVRRSVRRTLAAVARRALTSALENIGARFAAVPSGAFTLSGRDVTAVGPDAGAGDVAGRDCGPGLPDGRRSWRDADGTDGRGCVPAESLADDPDALLDGSGFSLAFSDGDAEPSGPLWSVWGRGDLGTFAGRPEPGMRHEGELRTGWLGVDARRGPWVAGLAVSHGRGEAEYAFRQAGAEERGRLETELTAFYPYGRWTFEDGLELHGVLGAGTGEARHVPEGGEAETGGLSMRIASAGLRRELAPVAGLGLALRADASVARMETGAGPGALHGLTADGWRLRAGLEATREIALEGGSLTPFLEAALRRDGGDGLEGTGAELAGGVRYAAPGVHLEARGRWLAAHTEEGAEERGLSVTARVGPGAGGLGPSFVLSTRGGAGTDGAEALWNAEMPEPGAGDGASVDARLGYGIGLPGRGLLTPFAEAALSDGAGGRIEAGARFEARRADLGLSLSGGREEGADGAGSNGLRLMLDWRF